MLNSSTSDPGRLPLSFREPVSPLAGAPRSPAKSGQRRP
jgi:hypothetical protein